MVRTFNGNNVSSLGGILDHTGSAARRREFAVQSQKPQDHDLVRLDPTIARVPPPHQPHSHLLLPVSCDHCPASSPFPSSPIPPPSVVHSHRDAMGNVYLIPSAPCCNHRRPKATAVIDLGMCQSCRKVYHDGTMGRNGRQAQSMEYDDLLKQKRREENEYRNSDPFVQPKMKSPSSEGFLDSKLDDDHPRHRHRHQAQATTQDSDDYGLGSGLNELSGTLAALQNATDSNILDESYDGGGRGGDHHQRHSWSAPNGGLLSEDHHGGDHHGGRRNRDPSSLSALRRDLDEQEKRLRRFEEGGGGGGGGGGGELSDPMGHLRKNDGARSGGRGARQPDSYSPSLLEEGGRGGRQHHGERGRGSNSKSAYNRDLDQQIEEQRERREREKKEEKNGDWWEKRSPRVKHRSGPHEKPHPSQHGHHGRADDFPKNDKESYQADLQQQIAYKKQQLEEEKRKEREEEERLERRIEEQQNKMKREYDEEVNKKKAKEEAKLRRQEEMLLKQQQIQADMERQKQEAADQKRKSRNAAAKKAAAAARGDSDRGRSPSPSPSASSSSSSSAQQPFRSNSPPIPSMRGKARQKQNPDQVVSQLSSMRHELDRKQEEVGRGFNSEEELE